jgi:hypothetical protein
MPVKTRAERKAYKLTAGLSEKGIRKLAAEQRRIFQQQADLCVALDQILAVFDYTGEDKPQRSVLADLLEQL